MARLGGLARPRQVFALALLALSACSASHRSLRRAPPADLEDEPEVLMWEELARPELLHTIASWLVSPDSASGPCPRVERSGGVTMITGDCATELGSRRVGKARFVTRRGEVRARFDGFGDDEQRVWGTVRVSTDGPPRFALDVRVQTHGRDAQVVSGSRWLAIDAEGRRGVGDRWFVEGSIGAEGKGVVRVKGDAIEVDADRCAHEPIDGRMELWSGDHYVEVRYDGAVDCDRDGTARWWLDGVEQGQLRGVSGHAGCAVVAPREASGPASVLLLLAVAGVRRRRSRPR